MWVSKLTIIGSESDLSPVRRHYLNQCCSIVDWTPRNRLHWHFSRNSYIFTRENPFENQVWKMAVILSRSQCVNTRVNASESNSCYSSETHSKCKCCKISFVYQMGPMLAPWTLRSGVLFYNGAQMTCNVEWLYFVRALNSSLSTMFPLWRHSNRSETLYRRKRRWGVVLQVWMSFMTY